MRAADIEPPEGGTNNHPGLANQGVLGLADVWQRFPNRPAEEFTGLPLQAHTEGLRIASEDGATR